MPKMIFNRTTCPQRRLVFNFIFLLSIQEHGTSDSLGPLALEAEDGLGAARAALEPLIVPYHTVSFAHYRP
jgi:hypothetical protein